MEKLHAIQEEQRLAVSGGESAAETQLDGGEVNTAHEADMDKTLVRLNNVTGGRPLFIFHGAGGGVLVMLKLCQKVEYPVFGVQDTPEAPISGTLECLSQFYLAKIKEKQPQGPYRLGGFSFGDWLPHDTLSIHSPCLSCRYCSRTQNSSNSGFGWPKS